MSNHQSSGVSRRGLLKGAAATGLVLGANGLPLPARGAPKAGGTFRIAIGHGQTTDTLDPAVWDNSFIISLGFAVHGRLTEVAPDGSLIPELAESWEGSDDATQWRFKIRPGVTFQSGKPLTPEDVVASINYHRGENSTSAAGPLVKPVTDVAIDGDTVVFTLDGGNADFPFILSDYHLVICPAKGDSIDWQSGDGCGAYRIVEFNPGVIARVEKFADFWDAGNRAWFQEIEMLSMIDQNARTTALVSGDVHAVDRLDLKTAGLMGRRPGVNIHSVSGTQHYTFAMSTNKDPYTDVHVRLALKYGINRQEIVDKILFGYGSVGNDHPIGSGQRFFNTELAQKEFDPDKARFHLKEAGLDKLDVALSASDAAFAGAVDAAVLFQASGKSAGINIDVIREPKDGYWSDVWMQKPFSAVYWSGRPVEDQMFATAYSCGAAWNDSFWCNDRFEKLMVEARAELDADKRRDMYWEMQDLVSNDGGVIIPMFANYVFATNDAVGVPEKMGTNWDLDGERFAERWWMA